ncbi:MAG: ABC transporter ATP-binding protein [Alphaproteobacteria bacterium]|nr:ABC transporter ATP-binding protein [Alphaproteobacteria bacterium]
MTLVLRFARRYMVPFWHWYLAGIVFLVLTNWISVTIPLYVAEGIDAIAQGEAGRPVIVSSALWVAGLGVLVIGIRTASRLLFFTPGRLVEANVKHDLFVRILEHQPGFLSNWPTGDLISRVSSDVGMLRLLAGFTALGVFNTISALALTGSQMLRISPFLAGLAALPLLFSFLVIQVFMRELHRVTQELQQVAGELSDHALSSYQGIATIQTFGAEDAFEEAFEKHNQAYLLATLKRANLRTVFGPILTLGAAVNVFLLLRYGGPMAMNGELTVGELVAFVTLVAYLTGPLRGMSFIIALVKQSQASLERIDVVLYAEPDRPEGPSGEAPPTHPPAIEVHDLSFRYPDGDHDVLHGVSLSVPAGGTLGIVGPTGSGKTTLLRVLARLYNPPPGTVRVDGHDVRGFDLDAWRDAMTLVPQRAYLFSESVRSNILLGADDDAKLRRVLTLAALDVDVAALRDGVETQVGEAGVTLSGGQRQRTALARGLARGQVVLMLDDVLSAVDHRTEQQLVDALKSRSPRPTTVIVAHRVSALQHADVIAVMEGGRVVDSGTHAELVARPGLYREIWRRQTETGESEGVHG